MESFIVERDYGAALEFEGELLGQVTSEPKWDRWRELRLYRTKGGSFVVHRIGHSDRPGEVTKHNAEVCKTEGDVIAFCEYSYLARSLYRVAGIAYTQRVD